MYIYNISISNAVIERICNSRGNLFFLSNYLRKLILNCIIKYFDLPLLLRNLNLFLEMRIKSQVVISRTRINLPRSSLQGPVQIDLIFIANIIS